MKYLVQHEGQEIPISESIGQDVDKLRRALTSIIPGIAEAKINSAVNGDGTVTTYTIVKTAGTKGNGIVDHLTECAGGINSLIVCYEAVEKIDLATLAPADLVLLEQRINNAAEEGGRQMDGMKHAFERLSSSSPQPSPFVILGF